MRLSALTKIRKMKTDSVFRYFDGFIEEIFEAQEFFIFLRILAELVAAHAQLDGEARQVGLVTPFGGIN